MAFEKPLKHYSTPHFTTLLAQLKPMLQLLLIGPLLVLLLLVTGCNSGDAVSDQPVAMNEKVEAGNAQPVAVERWLTVNDLFGLVSRQPAARAESFEKVRDGWNIAYVPMVLELMRLLQSPEFTVAGTQLLTEQTGRQPGEQLDDWYQWLWAQDYQPHPNYAEFKRQLYQLIDERFAAYFSADRATDIRLDEVRWGGVGQNGIPPLRNPKMLSPAEISNGNADWLESDNIVFGVAINDDVRAFPKRILAWHEMFIDTVGGVPVAGVYCTLCGALVLYETELNGTQYQLGTSGFLYRSNKLMFDEETSSLWNTLWGRPAVGPLVGKGIQLKYRSVVTTTWGEWRKRHPNTSVLSLETGYKRDYGEGIAYNDYFATDEIMFAVPRLGDSTISSNSGLANKAEVLAIRIAETEDIAVAIAAETLTNKPIFPLRIGSRDLVVLTDLSGANRVYDADNLRLKSFDGNTSVVDSGNRRWTLSESALVAADGERRARLPAHRAFWFGWQAAYPNTRLIR